MEITEESDWEEKQYVHSQIAYLIADITGRTVIKIEIDEDESGEYVYIYRPGFSQTFGARPPYSDDDEVQSSIFLNTNILRLYFILHNFQNTNPILLHLFL